MLTFLEELRDEVKALRSTVSSGKNIDNNDKFSSVDDLYHESSRKREEPHESSRLRKPSNPQQSYQSYQSMPSYYSAHQNLYPNFLNPLMPQYPPHTLPFSNQMYPQNNMFNYPIDMHRMSQLSQIPRQGKIKSEANSNIESRINNINQSDNQFSMHPKSDLNARGDFTADHANEGDSPLRGPVKSIGSRFLTRAEKNEKTH